MKKLRLQLIIVVLALVAIAGLLLSQQSTLQGIVVGPEPAAGGAYTEAVIGTPGRFNPLLDIYNPADRDINRLLFTGLIRFDDRGVPQPDLAESWGISQDGRSYNFSLRPDAVWHDGQPLTSDDIVFTIDLMRDEGFPLAADVRELWNNVEVRRLDDKTLQFRLPEPFSPFLDQLTFGVLPAHLLAGLGSEDIINAPFNLNPVGTGPYRFDSLIIEGGEIKGVVLRAFENYYKPRAFIDEFVFRYYPDAASVLEAYRGVVIQGLGNIPSDILPGALAEENLNVYSGRLPELSLILFNLKNDDVPFFRDLEVRKALYSGLNRQYMIDTILSSQAIQASGPIFPGTWAYFDGYTPVEFNPEGAVDTLRKAGYTIPSEGGSVRAREGQSLSFTLVYPDTPEHTALAEAIRDYWADLGVEAKLQAVEYQQLIEDYLATRDYEAALVDLNLARSPDPDPYPFWHQAQSPDGQNYSGWDDRQASEYLEAARVVVDPGERQRLYRNFQVRFQNELPALPLYYPIYNYGVDAAVRGVRMGALYDPADRFANVAEWFLFVGQAGSSTGAQLSTGAPQETAPPAATP